MHLFVLFEVSLTSPIGNVKMISLLYEIKKVSLSGFLHIIFQHVNIILFVLSGSWRRFSVAETAKQSHHIILNCVLMAKRKQHPCAQRKDLLFVFILDVDFDPFFLEMSSSGDDSSTTVISAEISLIEGPACALH